MLEGEGNVPQLVYFTPKGAAVPLEPHNSLHIGSPWLKTRLKSHDTWALTPDSQQLGIATWPSANETWVCFYCE